MELNKVKRTSVAAVAAGLTSTFLFLWSCGKDDKGGGGGGGEPGAQSPESPAPQGPAPASPANPDGTPNDGLVQLGDEAVGIKNGEQLVAHYSLMTGVKFEELSQQDRDAILRLKGSLPTDNAASKFNSAHVLATTKLATIMCQRFIQREEAIRGDNVPAELQGVEPKLPDLDWNSQKFPKELALPLYNKILELFWGVDTANLPNSKETTAALDELVDGLSKPYIQPDGSSVSVGVRGAVTALCVAAGAAFSSVEL